MEWRGIRLDILRPKRVRGPNIVRSFYSITLKLKKGVKFLFSEKATFATQFESPTKLWIVIIDVCGSKVKGEKLNNKFGYDDERSKSKVKHTHMSEQGLNNVKTPKRIKANF